VAVAWQVPKVLPIAIVIDDHNKSGLKFEAVSFFEREEKGKAPAAKQEPFR